MNPVEKVIKQDESSHYYLINLEDEDRFDKLAEDEDEWKEFEKLFGDMRINGYHSIVILESRKRF